MSEKTKDVLLSIFASLLCIVIGLLVGLIILYCINAENALDGFSRIIKGGFYLKPKGIGSEIAAGDTADHDGSFRCVCF